MTGRQADQCDCVINLLKKYRTLQSDETAKKMAMPETEMLILLDIMQSNGTIEIRSKLANGLTLFTVTNKGRGFSFIKLYEDNKLKEKRESKMENGTMDV